MESQSGKQGLEVLERYPMAASLSMYVLLLGWGEMLCRGVGDELMGGETLRGGVSGVPKVGQCSLGRDEESSPIALRMGLQLLMAWGSGGQHIAMLPPPAHMAPVCTLYAAPPTAADADELPGLMG